MLIFVSIFLIGIGWFTYTMKHEPRSLWAGVSFVTFLLTTAVFIVAILMRYSEFLYAHQWLVYIITFLAIIVTICMVLWPFVLVSAFLYNGIKVILNEGFKFHNLLSLGFGIFCVAYLVIWPMFGHFTDKNIWMYAYGYLGSVTVYFLLVMVMYTVTLTLNLVHLKLPKLDYIVVLGAGLNGTEVTPLLAARIDRALEIYRKTPGLKLIMSGGKGPDEVIAEGEAMQNYAVKQGIPADDIIVENKSTTTYENILFSHRLMTPEAKFGIATNSYRVYRALVIAKRQGLKCVGFGAKTRWYFTLNAFMREYIAYLRITYKLQLSVILALGVVYMAFAYLKI